MLRLVPWALRLEFITLNSDSNVHYHEHINSTSRPCLLYRKDSINFCSIMIFSVEKHEIWSWNGNLPATSSTKLRTTFFLIWKKVIWLEFVVNQIADWSSWQLNPNFHIIFVTVIVWKEVSTVSCSRQGLAEGTRSNNYPYSFSSLFSGLVLLFEPSDCFEEIIIRSAVSQRYILNWPASIVWQ